MDPEAVESIVVLDDPLYIINGHQYTEQELFGRILPALTIRLANNKSNPCQSCRATKRLPLTEKRAKRRGHHCHQKPKTRSDAQGVNH
jgi:hypothetical protein